MGCVSSKQSKAVCATPPAIDDYSEKLRDNGLGNKGSRKRGEIEKKSSRKKSESSASGSEIGGGDSISLRLGNLPKYVEGEQVAAGWPAWLSAVAGEAIQGWIPLRADSFEKLEKIGQGTYSSVFRARDLETGKIVALKKVRFDNFDPESVRFMAREIKILRRLDHPNIVKLEGLITSRLSCSIYLVFEYMEHDLAGLASAPDIKFSEAQVKCYMHQLLSGIEHCHSRGVMHRDIKGSNLLVSNEGIVKIADFGLANFFNPGHRQPLTSRVVTLWYRPPELLLGSTEYGAAVDLWSVGCVFAELFLGKPILQGRTEVEQLHKIFKLCGSPPDEYWKKSKLPHATIFKPQHNYESSLHETCKGFPTTALNLMKTLLSIDSHKRGSAASALASEYFRTKPYASDPSTLPKYPPNKEIDAKSREEARRKKNGGRSRGPDSRKGGKAPKPFRESNGPRKLAAPTEEQLNAQISQKLSRDNNIPLPPKGDVPPKPSVDMPHDPSHTKYASQGDIPFSVSSSSGFAWAKRRKDDPSSLRSNSRHSSRSQVSSSAFDISNGCESKRLEDGEVDGTRNRSRGYSHENSNRMMRKQWSQLDRPDSFDASDVYHSQELSAPNRQKERKETKPYHLDYQDDGSMVEFSGPLLSQTHKIDELLERHERHIRQAVRRSWFQRDKKHAK
ncbi:[pyruvate dehydrogenase (acetyl-transferring)] kinase [Ranunculus cassubicifolius]